MATRPPSHPGGPQGRLRRRPGGPRAATRSSVLRPGRMAWSTAGRPCACRATTTMKLLREARGARTCRSRTAWPRRSPRSTRCPTTRASFRERGRRVPRRAGQPLRPRRRQAGRRPRRDEGGDAGPRLGPGPRLRPLRRDDRRDRRVRPAGPPQLGGGLPRRGDGRLRPHAGARAGLAQPHDQHRHRLRLRRQAHRPALPGEGVRLGPGAAHLLRAGPAVPRRRAAARRAHGAAGARRRARRSRTCSASGSSRPGCAATSRSARRTPRRRWR